MTANFTGFEPNFARLKSFLFSPIPGTGLPIVLFASIKSLYDELKLMAVEGVES